MSLFSWFAENFDLPILDWIAEHLYCGFLDKLMPLITMLGEETVFILVGLLFFWCINKREGYYLLTVGLIGTVINQFLKLLFRVPRPWVLDPNFTIVESARAEATGYSFPSGHTQNVSTWSTMFAKKTKKVWLAILISLVCNFIGAILSCLLCKIM